jgi:hypothetical protein
VVALLPQYREILELHRGLPGGIVMMFNVPGSKSGMVLRDFAQNGGYEFLGLNSAV